MYAISAVTVYYFNYLRFLLVRRKILRLYFSGSE